MTCLKCKSGNLDVNGLLYQCLDCGDVDDSTFNMIAKRSKKCEGKDDNNN